MPAVHRLAAARPGPGSRVKTALRVGPQRTIQRLPCFRIFAIGGEVVAEIAPGRRRQRIKFDRFFGLLDAFPPDGPGWPGATHNDGSRCCPVQRLRFFEVSQRAVPIPWKVRAHPAPHRIAVGSIRCQRDGGFRRRPRPLFCRRILDGCPCVIGRKDLGVSQTGISGCVGGIQFNGARECCRPWDWRCGAGW